MKKMPFLFWGIMLLTFACSTQEKKSSYFDQNPPGLEPQIFAPGKISLPDRYEFGSVFSPQADEFFFAVRVDEEWNAEIWFSKYNAQKWSTPARFGLDPRFSYNDSFVSADGQRLYFMSTRPIQDDGKVKDSDLWYVQKSNDGWTKPINLGAPVNCERNEFYITMTDSGTIYFSTNRHTAADDWDYDIYYSTLKNQHYSEPVRLDSMINSSRFDVDAFVAPDESYLIFSSSRPGGFGSGDLYISFKTETGWSKAQNMGKTINTEAREFCPCVTRDGKYLFYSSGGDIYWVSAEILQKFGK